MNSGRWGAADVDKSWLSGLTMMSRLADLLALIRPMAALRPAAET